MPEPEMLRTPKGVGLGLGEEPGSGEGLGHDLPQDQALGLNQSPGCGTGPGLDHGAGQPADTRAAAGGRPATVTADGLPPPAGGRRPKQASRAGQHARMRLASRTLEHLPVAVAVIDRGLTLHYWNLHAATLLNLPPLMRDDTPSLGQALRAGGRLSPRQVARILAFCDAGIEGEGRVPSCWLRLSLSRQHRIVVKLHPCGPDRWILGVEEVHPLGHAFAAGHDAMVDPLTGLSNRRHFTETLEDLLPAHGEVGRHAVLLIDLDRFEAANERLGRAVGDALLILVAQRLQRETRDEDLVARMGGDAFAILASNGAHAEALAGRVLAMIARPFMVEGHAVNLGASIGIARCPEHGNAPDLLLRHADVALYAAKAAGRQTWRMFDPGFAHRAVARRGLEKDLRAALTLGEMWLAYEPQRDVDTRRLTGFGVAPRWTHATRGPVPAETFLPVAEETGCVVPLYEWALRTACADAAGWPAPLSVSVPVSAAQLDDPDRLSATVQSALAATGLGPTQLELVVNGTAIASRAGPVGDLIERLRPLGVRVTMTGFAAGWGSLRQLRGFPFDRVAIDSVLVAALHADAETAAMVRAVVTLANDLGMSCVGCGVATPEQADLLSEQGCRALQGPLSGEALDSAGVADLLRGSVGA